ncbi:MAG: outer membrane beta-barrel protein [Sphingobacteriaceae bacterium]|nr:outer membrane beta-barrel protein [Sphingobacteriaceae bacterium]
MKKIFLILIVALLTGKIYGQTPDAPGREISGIVKDSADNAVIGAIVVLKYGADSARLLTNTNGVFVFKNVKAGEFLITVRSIGFANFNKRFLFNAGSNRLILDPIIMRESSNMLNAVVINGTPAITYKEDTVEYRASDYVVKPNATVDELIKKMEGVEVGADGTVTHQGTQVQKFRLNGKDYSGGDVATAIQSLPAEIVEKVQFVDDFGNEAARTGIKDGEPTKVMNVTTRRDRSVGNNGRLNVGVGNNERYGTSILGNRINGNQQINLNLNFNNTVTGVAGGSGNSGFTGGGQGGGFTGGQGGQRGNGGGGLGGGAQQSGGNNGGSSSGGTNQSGGGSVGFRDQFGKKIGLNTSYSYRFNDNNSINNSNSERYTALTDPTTGKILIDPVTKTRADTTTFITTSNTSRQNAKTNTFNFDLEYEIDSANFLRFSPNISYVTSLNNSSTNESKLGYQHRNDIGSNDRKNTTPTFGGNLIFQHQFEKRGRSASVNLGYDANNAEAETDVDAIVQLFEKDNTPLPDSIVRRLVLSKNLRNTTSASFTFSEPLKLVQGNTSRLQFNVSVNRRQYDNTRFTDNMRTGQPVRVDSLSNIFNYSFTTTRLGLNYNVRKTKYNSSLGVTVVPSVLEGTKEHLGVTLRRANLTLIPIANYEYQLSRTNRLGVRYSGSPQEPTFDQIQPVRDDTDPNNPKVGNEKLKVAFNHNITANYNNFIANRNLNIYANITGTTNPNRVTTNVVEYFKPADLDSADLIRETRYINLDGAHSLGGNYGISKSLNKRKYRIDFTGSVRYNKSVSMSNNVLNNGKSWTFTDQLGLQINPNSWLELNPTASYNLTKANYTISTRDNLTKTFALSANGRVYMLKRNVLNFNVRKNFVSGINANVTNNPFVINTSIERQFFKRNNGSLGIQAFDLLNQNNFISRSLSENGFTDTKSNALSRYFMINFRWTPQKWTGAPTNRNGRPVNRRGDGSFIEN